MTTAQRPIPTNPADLTPEWLTAALRSTATVRDASITSFDSRVIGEGAGFMGQLVRLSLQYDRPEAGAPASLIAKLPAAAPENREVAAFFRFYEREVRFYEQIADQVELRTPRRYYSAFEPESGDFVLLLEDLTPACVGDQLAGCPVAQAELAIRELARFHATWWDSPKLDKLDWMPAIDDDWYIESVVQGYRDAWPAFVERFGDRLTPGQRQVFEKFGQRIPQVMNQIGLAPITIMHGDYRLDNLFFATPAGGAPFAVIDWQISARARGVFDFAYFIAGTLPVEERRANEDKLLRMYHEILQERGVRGYEFDRCLTDYRRSALILLAYSVIALGSLDMANERGVDLFTTILDRTRTAVSDLDAGALLPD